MSDLVSTLSLATLAKVGSALIHAEEFMSADGHDFDRAAFESLMADPDVRKWLDAMQGMSLVPRKRNV